jgi:hypothetical protein
MKLKTAFNDRDELTAYLPRAQRQNLDPRIAPGSDFSAGSASRVALRFLISSAMRPSNGDVLSRRHAAIKSIVGEASVSGR